MAKSEDRKETGREEPQMQMEVTAKETGQRKTVNGFDTEVLTVAPDVSEADVSIPAGFKQK